MQSYQSWHTASSLAHTPTPSHLWLPPRQSKVWRTNIRTTKIMASSNLASPDALATIHKYFPQAFPDTVYFQAAQEGVAKLGFEKEYTFASVNTCRDEIARPISHFFDKNYGHSFNFSGIAGIITAGTLGILAATSHAPNTPDGRPKYLFFGSTHTAVGEDGTEGAILRAGQENKVGNACGAIEAIKGEIKKGIQLQPVRDDNVEYDILKKKIFSHDPPPTDNATNFDLTKITADVITDDLNDLISKTVDPSKADYVVLTGVQIHSGVKGSVHGNHVDYIAPVASYAVLKGKKSDLKFVDGEGGNPKLVIDQ